MKISFDVQLLTANMNPVENVGSHHMESRHVIGKKKHMFGFK